MEKPKIKGMPGRRKQNVLFLIAGLLTGIIGTAALVAALMGQRTSEEVTALPTLIPSSTFTATVTPTLPPTYTPTPTYPPSTSTPLPTLTPLPVLPQGQPLTANPVTALAIAPNNRLVALSYQYEERGILETRRILNDGSIHFGDMFQFASLAADKLFFNTAGDKLVAISHSANSVWVYNVAARMEMAHFAGYTLAAFTPDDRWLMLSDGATLMFLDGATLTRMDEREMAGQIQALDVTVNQQLAIALEQANNTGLIRLVDLNDTTKLLAEYVTESPVHRLKFSPDGTLLAAAFDSRVAAYDLKTGTRYDFYLDDLGLIRDLTFSPDSLWLAAGGGNFEDGFVTGTYVWKRDTTGTLPAGRFAIDSRILVGHSHDVTAITFTLDGSYLLSASTDGMVRWWDYHTGALIAEERI